jgi:formyl-CoA transferase
MIAVAPALEGVRVLDISEGIAGPYCTRLLAGFGADVIKVERPGAGDPARALPPFPDDEPHPEKSGTFLVLNMAKKSITLDWRTASGRHLLRRLLEDADILVESSGTDALAWLGLDDDRLAHDRPDLVVTSITPFGLTGPYAGYQYSEGVIVAIGGLMSLTGEPDREPLKNGANISAMGAGLNAYSATVAALYSRMRFGEGEHLDISVFDHIATIPEVYVQMTVVDGEPRTRLGNRTGATWGLFPAAEGHVAVACDYRRDLTHLAGAFEVPELLAPRYDDFLYGRAEHIEEIEALVRGALLTGPAEAIYHRAQAAHLPWGYVATPEDLVHSEQFKARGFFAEVDRPYAGRQTYSQGPVLMSEGSWVTERAPLLGEHNAEILEGRLGLSRRELAALRRAGVV